MHTSPLIRKPMAESFRLIKSDCMVARRSRRVNLVIYRREGEEEHAIEKLQARRGNSHSPPGHPRAPEDRAPGRGRISAPRFDPGHRGGSLPTHLPSGAG